MKLEQWYVVFTDYERETWYTRFLKPGYGHCYLVRWDGYNWIRVRPDLSKVHIEVLPVIESDAVEQVVLGNTAVLVEVPSEDLRIRLPWMVTIASCVEGVKAILGIRAVHILTPYQLFRYLVARKHERWWRRRADRRTEGTATTSVAGVRQGEAAGVASSRSPGTGPTGKTVPDVR